MEDTRKSYRLFVISIFVILLTAGIFIGLKVTKEDVEEMATTVTNKENIEVYVEPYKEEITDVEIIYVDIYKECNHTMQRKLYEYGKTMGEIKARETNNIANVQGYSLVKDSDSILMFEKEYSCKCPNHYVLKMEDNNVSIFRYSDTDGYIKYRDTDIVTETLRPDVKAQLERGIEAETTEELYMILEDMES